MRIKWNNAGKLMKTMFGTYYVLNWELGKKDISLLSHLAILSIDKLYRPNPRFLEDLPCCQYEELCQVSLLLLPASEQQVPLLPSLLDISAWGAGPEPQTRPTIFIQWLAVLVDQEPHPQASYSGSIESRGLGERNSPLKFSRRPLIEQCFAGKSCMDRGIECLKLPMKWTSFSTWLFFLCVREL